MGKLNGSLNSVSTNGQNYFSKGNTEYIKYVNLSKISKSNMLWSKWYKKSKLTNPSWSKALWNWGKLIEYSQRTENHGSRRKVVSIPRYKDWV